jgi:hypothetical protein
MPEMPPPADPPPRAFAQGVGTVFQGVGTTLFLMMLAVCCLSSLLSKGTAQRTDLAGVGWRLPGQDPTQPPLYSASIAVSLSVVFGMVLGMALAGSGLGLQAMRRSGAMAALVSALAGAIFWPVQAVFAARVLGSVLLSGLAALLAVMFLTLTLLALGAWREMRRTPPPEDVDVLPDSYKIPYSHYHQDPPEVRLERELEQRRRKLEAQQKELEAMEQELRRKRPAN